jgi:hypothetical protein
MVSTSGLRPLLGAHLCAEPVQVRSRIGVQSLQSSLRCAAQLLEGCGCVATRKRALVQNADGGLR